jgi:hypothetical protein
VTGSAPGFRCGGTPMTRVTPCFQTVGAERPRGCWAAAAVALGCVWTPRQASRCGPYVARGNLRVGSWFRPVEAKTSCYQAKCNDVVGCHRRTVFESTRDRVDQSSLPFRKRRRSCQVSYDLVEPDSAFVVMSTVLDHTGIGCGAVAGDGSTGVARGWRGTANLPVGDARL